MVFQISLPDEASEASDGRNSVRHWLTEQAHWMYTSTNTEHEPIADGHQRGVTLAEDWMGLRAFARDSPLQMLLAGAVEDGGSCLPFGEKVSLDEPPVDYTEQDEAPCSFRSKSLTRKEEEKIGAETRAEASQRLRTARQKFERSVHGEKHRCIKLLLEDNFDARRSEPELHEKAQRDLQHLQSTRAQQFNARLADHEGKHMTASLADLVQNSVSRTPLLHTSDIPPCSSPCAVFCPSAFCS